MPTDATDPLFARFAARCSLDPLFFGRRLAQYAARHGLGDAQLAAWLGCEVGTLDRLRVCRVPVGEGQVREVAVVCGVREERVWEVLGDVG